MTTQHDAAPRDAGLDDPFIGRRLGRYAIEAALGRGRDATVYAAHDPIIGRTVAIKILDPLVARDEATRARFLREASALSQLRHPHILPIYEVAERGVVAFLARQETGGGTLRSFLADAGPLSPDAAGSLLRPIAVALDYAHRQGFVHGNLRPSAILRTNDGQVFLTDFIAPGEAAPTASAAATVISAIDAPEYVSPEAARGGGEVAAGDLYVLGAILYEALTGRPPFRADQEGESARNVLTQHLHAAPPDPVALNPALGPAIAAVLLRALAKRPEERFPTAAALLFALGEAAAQDGADSAPPTRPRESRVVSATKAAPEPLVGKVAEDDRPSAAAPPTAAPVSSPAAAVAAPIATPLYLQPLVIALIGLVALLAGMLVGLLLAL